MKSPTLSPVSSDGCPAIAVFGAGIAGLTVAHELSLRGWRVTVYEVNQEVGGFFRSARAKEDDGMPSEYSWHGIGPWYANTLAVMKQIEVIPGLSVYDHALSRPVSFAMVPDEGPPMFDACNRFRMTRLDLLRWGWLMLKTWTAGRRSREVYAGINAAEAYRPLLSDVAWKTWRASFGPWVGSDWLNVSLHQVGLFFRKQFFAGEPHQHRADDDGPAWTHGSRVGWLVLRGPSSEAWFDPWVKVLESRGVQFRYGAELAKLELEDPSLQLDLTDDGTLGVSPMPLRISKAKLASGESIEADDYVLATNPFAARDVIGRTPDLSTLDELKLLEPLVQDGPHTQVSFRIAFAERIEWPRERPAVVIADSPWNITICPQEQVWHADEDLGPGVKSLWTGTACVSQIRGHVHGIVLEDCSEEQFVDEIMAQISSCSALRTMLMDANQGRAWDDQVVRVEVWHEWIFSPQTGIDHPQPKWVNTTNTQPFLPGQATPISNLFIAGAHTRTDADVWSIEAAVESGRRVAKLLEPDVPVVGEYIPSPLRLARGLDDLCYRLRLPHVIDLVLVSAVFLILVLACAI